MFEGRDVRERDPLDVGDAPWSLSSPPTTAARQVRAVKVLERGGGLPRERGVVVSMKDDRQFGFIRAEEGGAAQVRNSGAILCAILRNSAQFCANSLERCIHPPAALLPLPAAAAAGRRRRARRHRGLVHPFFRPAHQEGAGESPRGAAARHRRLRRESVPTQSSARSSSARCRRAARASTGGASRAEKHAHGGLLRVVGARRDSRGAASAANVEPIANAAGGTAASAAAAGAAAPDARTGARRRPRAAPAADAKKEMAEVVHVDWTLTR